MVRRDGARRTPDSSIGAMNKAINQALQKQELIDKLRRIGAQPMPELAAGFRPLHRCRTQTVGAVGQVARRTGGLMP